jgi:Phage capsid protein
MADTAFQTQYRDEFIAGFEARQSLLRDTVTTEFEKTRGNTVVFLVADSGGAEAQTRGVNGLIPARADNLTQNSCSLAEWHDLVRKTGFNVFASQGDQRRIMQETTMAVLNRKVDSDIVTALDTTTVSITVSGTPTVDAVQHAQAKLQAASVPWDSNITLLCQPVFLSYIEQAPEFAKATYVNMKPFSGEDQNANWRDTPMAYRWKNMLIVAHPNLPGKATATESSYMYHKSAIGHAADKSSLSSAVGYDDEQDYSFARATMYMGAKLLQNSGVVEIISDGSARA